MYNLESQLSTISRNCKNDYIAIGGRSLMKVLKLTENNEFKIMKVLKTAKTNSKVGTTDLEWNNFLENILASTTLQNSQVLVWDINQISINLLNQRLGSHTQLINRINWSHTDPDLLASCSQDGFLNIWNRNSKPDLPVISMHHKEKIRDCQFSPLKGNHILASYTSGAVKLWDTRYHKTCVKEYISHEYDVLSVDWHPVLENVFCSGGMDKNMFIWDTNTNVPILSYKTSHGTSRVKWWKKNPQYIISSYQTNNFYASMWNINIDNMPEYQYKGHKDVVTGFCWDLSETRLITCSKDNYVIVNNFADGYRCMDNVSTKIVKYCHDDNFLTYSDTKPSRTDFDKVNYSRLSKLSNGEKRSKDTKNNLILIKNTKEILENPNFLAKNPKLVHFYTFSIDQIKEIFKNYIFVTNCNYFIDDISEYREGSFSMQLSKIVSHNWKYSKDKQNYNHYAVWSQLKFLCESDSFTCVDNIIKPSKFKSSESCYGLGYMCKNDNMQLMIEIIQSNIMEIINFLINVHSDIYLATIIVYLFFNILDYETNHKTKLLRIELECFENLQRNKLVLITAKMMKFAHFAELKKNRENNLFLSSCKKCNITYIPSLGMGKCTNCKTEIKCQICLLPVNGLYCWCSYCGHGGHPEHISSWFSSDNQACPSGCGHRCNRFYRVHK